MKQWLFIFLTSSFLLFAEDPWGADWDLARPVEKKERFLDSTSPSTPLSRWGISLIRFHQEVISPADGPRSHYVPSSSQYTLESMNKYGFFWGVLYGCDRLMRENNDPWIYPKTYHPDGYLLKSNPVP